MAVSHSAHVAPNATVYGDVFIAHDSYVGFGAVVDGLNSPVRIGSNTKVGDNSTVQSAFWVPDDAFPLSTTIGNNVNIEHSCNITNAILDDDVHIGFRSVVMEGAQIERGYIYQYLEWLWPLTLTFQQVADCLRIHYGQEIQSNLLKIYSLTLKESKNPSKKSNYSCKSKPKYYDSS